MKRYIPSVLAVLFLLLSFFFAILAFIPFDSLLAALNTLMSDGSFESLTLDNAIIFRALFLGGALLFGVVTWLVTFQRDRLKTLPASLGEDGRDLWRGFRFPEDPAGRAYWFAVALITISGLIIRLANINRFMLYDESYTAAVFATSLRTALTDYHLPNNHVLHTVLVVLSTQLFGLAPWAVRLPTLTFGVLLIPAVYIFGARFYDRATGLLAAILVSLAPTLISSSWDARGYGLLTFLTLAALSLAHYLRTHRNLLGWELLALLCALGFFTVPVMFFPFGIIFAWLFFENLFGSLKAYRSKLDFWIWWAISGLSSALVTLLLYTSIFIYSGPKAVFENNFIASMPWDVFDDYLPYRLGETFSVWTRTVPPALVALLVFGGIIAFFFYRRIASHRFPLPLAAFLWITLLLLLRRPDPHGKIWFYLLPILLTWCAAGLSFLLQKVRFRFLPLWSLADITLGLLTLGITIFALIQVPALPNHWADTGDMNGLVVRLKDQVQPGDLILTYQSAPQLWYYSRWHGISSDHFDSKQPYRRLLIVTDEVYAETIAQVLSYLRFESYCSDANSQVLLQNGIFTVYECSTP